MRTLSQSETPAGTFAASLEGVLTGNYTVFPRRAAWWSDRVGYNGDAHDEAIWIVTRESVPMVWDRRVGSFVRRDRAARLQLDAQLVHLEIWNDSYGVLLDRWADQIERVLQEVTRRTGGGLEQGIAAVTEQSG